MHMECEWFGDVRAISTTNFEWCMCVCVSFCLICFVKFFSFSDFSCVCGKTRLECHSVHCSHNIVKHRTNNTQSSEAPQPYHNFWFARMQFLGIIAQFYFLNAHKKRRACAPYTFQEWISFARRRLIFSYRSPYVVHQDVCIHLFDDSTLILSMPKCNCATHKCVCMFFNSIIFNTPKRRYILIAL